MRGFVERMNDLVKNAAGKNGRLVVTRHSGSTRHRWMEMDERSRFFRLWFGKVFQFAVD